MEEVWRKYGALLLIGGYLSRVCSDHVEFCRVSGIPGLSASAFTSLFLSYSPWRSWQSSHLHLISGSRPIFVRKCVYSGRSGKSSQRLFFSRFVAIPLPSSCRHVAFSLRLSISVAFDQPVRSAPVFGQTGPVSHHFLLQPHRFCTVCRASFPGKPTCTESAPVLGQTGPVSDHCSNSTVSAPVYRVSLPEANVYQFRFNRSDPAPLTLKPVGFAPPSSQTAPILHGLPAGSSPEANMH